MRARSGFLAVALPAVVLLLIDWAFWGLRAEQAGWGVNIDGLALFAAFVVALAASGADVPADEPRPSLFDAMLHRFAIASFGVLAASICGALFAYIRLGSISLGPELRSEPMGGRFLLVALLLIVAPLGVWLGRQGALRLTHGARILLAFGALALSSWVTLRPQQTGARLEYLGAEFRTVASLPALSFEVTIERTTIGGAGFEYLAVSNNCVLRPRALEPNRPIAAQSVAVPARASTAGFAACPAIDLYEITGQAYGLVAGSPHDSKPLFRVVNGKLLDPLTHGSDPVPPSAGKKVGVIPSIRAPLGVTSDQDTGEGITIKRDASSLERCRIEVRDGDKLLHDDATVFSGNGSVMAACRPVTVVRAASLGILNLQIPGSDTASGSPEPSSRSWLDGVGNAGVPLELVAERVEIPRAWRRGALAGLACGALALLYSLLELVRLRRLRDFVAAHHEGGGKITLADGAIIDAEAARELEVDEVFVRGALPKARLPGYRESAQETARSLEVRAPRAVHLDWGRTSGRVTFASAIALAFPIATSALVFAARVFGLGG